LSEGQRLSRPARAAFAGALAIYLGVAGWLVWRTSILEPYSDMYDWLARWRAWQADGNLGRYLWAPHNFHHLVWTFTVLALDIRAFGASGYLFLAVGVICLAATAAMLARFASRAAGPGLGLIGGGVALALSLMGCDILDATADINITYVQALLFAVAAILLVQRQVRWRRWRLFLSFLVCAPAAGLGSAAGLAVWPALLFVFWRSDKPRHVLPLASMSVSFAAIYLFGQSYATSGLAVHGGGLQSVELILNYLALPWVRAVPAAGLPLGVVVLAVSLVALAGAFRQEAQGTARIAGALILFSLGTAAMAGLARTGATAPSLVPMRYAAFMIPLHVGLWVLALPYMRRFRARRPRARDAAVIAVAVAMLGHQGLMGLFAVRTADINLRVVADFREGRRSPAMLTAIGPDLALRAAQAAQLRREGRYQRELRRDPPTAGGSGTSASSPGR